MASNAQAELADGWPEVAGCLQTRGLLLSWLIDRQVVSNAQADWLTDGLKWLSGCLADPLPLLSWLTV